MKDIFEKLKLDRSAAIEDARGFRLVYDSDLAGNPTPTIGDYQKTWRRFQAALRKLDYALVGLDEVLQEFRSTDRPGMHIANDINVNYELGRDPFGALAYV
jgi:hypothetical protein